MLSTSDADESNPTHDIWDRISPWIPDLYAYAFRICGAQMDSEDIVQSVCLRAIRYRESFENAIEPRAYLMRMVRNEANRKFKSRREKTNSDLLDSESASYEESKIDATDSVQFALRKLPEDQRTVLFLYFFESCSYDQIASELNIPMGTVMSRLYRAKQQLRSILEAVENAESNRTHYNRDE